MNKRIIKTIHKIGYITFLASPFLGILLYSILLFYLIINTSIFNQKINLYFFEFNSFLLSYIFYFLPIYFFKKIYLYIDRLFPVEWKYNFEFIWKKSDDVKIKNYFNYYRVYVHQKGGKEFLNSQLILLISKLNYIPDENVFKSLPKDKNINIEIRQIASLLVESEYSIKQHFGSYKFFLTENGYIVSQLYGSLVKAKSGNMCYSMGELKIDNYLFDNGYKYEKEPLYPHHPHYNKNCRKRADWAVAGSIYIEYYGLKGKKEYDKKTIIKKKLAEELNLIVIELFEQDLDELHHKLDSLTELIKNQEKVKQFQNYSQSKFMSKKPYDLQKIFEKELTQEQIDKGMLLLNKFFDKGIFSFSSIAATVQKKLNDEDRFERMIPALFRLYSIRYIQVEDEIADKMDGRNEVRKIIQDYFEAKKKAEEEIEIILENKS